ncbi:ORF136 similar to XcGV ORF173 [Cydia pomonella granulovirus]|uniref:ORF136 n=2 Tax=Cydia pomonella granulosis virus TaxID=28289 RepID=A0A097P1N9_GVCP|nr:ORF136 similar to XcGV ORF173 [Cydia pomonella granulovirus]AAK70796.1 ORF136 similar to XcGV ORF173 [Cydia pomonella granulovirus]AIU36782.1 ORF136 [Cydia pomonella granulovirus]AIU36919.1 ORF136 [Cydia pomonella granulovirus]AIU37061.1 ORF136 [Cydia pomonella granulovirus]AIU37203.1 ORF136 [Cydia pomonella granulovirus]
MLSSDSTIDLANLSSTIDFVTERDVLLAEQFVLEGREDDLYKYKSVDGKLSTYFTEPLLDLDNIRGDQFVVVH